VPNLPKGKYHLSCCQIFLEEAWKEEDFSKRCYNNRSKTAEKKRNLGSGPMNNVSSESVLGKKLEKRK